MTTAAAPAATNPAIDAPKEPAPFVPVGVDEVLVLVLVAVIELPPPLSVAVDCARGATVPPKTDGGDSAVEAFRAAARYVSRLLLPLGLMTADMPFLQCDPVFCEQ